MGKISIIPNTITLGNLFFGFFAIISSFNGNLNFMFLFFLGSLLFDMADGFFARILNSSSKVGLELDSLADGISFVFVPSFIAYSFLFENSFLGILSAVAILGNGIFRLARFNLGGESKFFKGLPTPFFAIIIYALIYGNFKSFALVLLPLSFIMTSNIPFPSFKNKNLFKNKLPLIVYLISGLVLSFVLFLFGLGFVSIISIILIYLILASSFVEVFK